MSTIETVFLNNIANKRYTSFYTLKMISGKRPEYQQKRILDLSVLFTITNIASGYTPCHLENFYFLLYVYFQIVTRKSVKKNTLNIKCIKGGAKRINMKTTQTFHFTQPSQAVFTGSYNKKRHQIKCVKLRFCKCARFLLF